MPRSLAVTLFTAFLVAGCDPSVPVLTVGEIEYTAGLGSAEPSLHVTPDGRVLLTWLEPLGEDRHALRVAVRSGGTWSDPKTIHESDRFFVNWADFPSLLELSDGAWLVHWLEKVQGGTYAYHVRLAISKDGGASWGAPITPHIDDSPTEHGFVSMVPLAAGAAALVWLDGRAMRVEDDETHQGIDMGEMSLRGTTIDSDGALGPDLLLDSRTCECCQTSLVQSEDGLVAAYRDRSEEEIRDIAVVRYVDGSWTQPRRVAEDNWYYPGCPVNGPQLAANGDTVAVAWFTAPERKPAVLVAYSFDGGASFQAPIRVDGGEALGRVDLELMSDNTAVVAWLERTESAAEIRVRHVSPARILGESAVVAQTSEARASGFPRLARSGDEIVVAWTALGETSYVRVATVRPAR